jgi:hypothetical protein
MINKRFKSAVQVSRYCPGEYRGHLGRTFSENHCPLWWVSRCPSKYTYRVYIYYVLVKIAVYGK